MKKTTKTVIEIEARSEFVFSEIAKAAPAETVAGIIVGRQNALVWVKQSFASSFDVADNIMLRGRLFGNYWGTSAYANEPRIDEKHYLEQSGATGKECDGYRTDVISLEEIDGFIAEIKKAKAYRRKIRLEVEYI